jgi:hypothetical protein
MRLSLCSLTSETPEVIAAVIAPWREVADEVVLGVDDRVPDADWSGYKRLADKVIPFRFAFLERHLDELHAACTGDWIMRVDSDEVPSAALLRRFPHLLHERGVKQYRIARRLLFPDQDHWIDEVPWWPDLQTRLVRNDDSLHFSGHLHSSADRVDPSVCIAEPLYHLERFTHEPAQLFLKALRYDIQRPDLLGPGSRPMGRYYEPERHGTRSVAPVPAEDRATIAAALRDRPGRQAVPQVPVQRHADAETLRAACRDSVIELLERDLRFYPGESREVLVAATNRTATTWGDPDCNTAGVRLSYRLRAPKAPQDGPRTGFPVPVAPGEQSIVPMLITAPEEVGRHRLELGIVHEHVRWLDATCDVTISVISQPSPPDRREPAPSAARRRRRWPRRRSRPEPAIPRILHRIWLGDAPLPAEYREYGESWQRHHPEWEVHLWTDDTAPHPPGASRARTHAERSDLIRYNLIHRFGGVYVDTDIECLRPIDDLLTDVQAFAAYESPGVVCSAVLGAVPGHPAFAQLSEFSAMTVGTGIVGHATGPTFVTHVFDRRDDVVLFEPERFYPYHWDQQPEFDRDRPGVYAVHHWAKSWVQDSVG